MKAVWDGSISFGLVNIPIKLYSATQPQSIGFRMLCGKCHTPLKYKRYCEKCKKEVAWNNVVKGLEIAKGKFYVLTKEKLEKLKPERSKFIEILSFVDKSQIDTIYYNKHYFIVPKDENEKAYFLFQEILSLTGKVAVGKFVMRDREHICMIYPYRKGMVLTTLNYVHEVRNIEKLENLKSRPRLTKREMKLAKKLMQQMYEKDFDISEFKDTFAEEIKKIALKELKGEAVIVKVKKRKKKTENLLAALEASLK